MTTAEAELLERLRTTDSTAAPWLEYDDIQAAKGLDDLGYVTICSHPVNGRLVYLTLKGAHGLPGAGG